MKKTTTADMQKKIANMLNAITCYYVDSTAEKMTCGEWREQLVNTIHHPVEVTDYIKTFYVEYVPECDMISIYTVVPHKGFKNEEIIICDNLTQAQAIAKTVMKIDRLFN